MSARINLGIRGSQAVRSLAASLLLADLRQAFSSEDTEDNASTPTARYTAAPPVVRAPAPLSLPTEQRYCIFHKTATHSIDECDAVKQLFNMPYRTRIRVGQGALVFSEDVGTLLFSNHEGISSPGPRFCTFRLWHLAFLS